MKTVHHILYDADILCGETKALEHHAHSRTNCRHKHWYYQINLIEYYGLRVAEYGGVWCAACVERLALVILNEALDE